MNLLSAFYQVLFVLSCCSPYVVDRAIRLSKRADYTVSNQVSNRATGSNIVPLQFNVIATDTIILDEIQIQRQTIHPDSLQVNAYFKKMLEKKKKEPTWQKVFIDRTTTNAYSPFNRGNSTSSLVSVDVLSVLRSSNKKGKSKEANKKALEKVENYITQHFDSVLVKRVTRFSGEQLSHFTRVSRPSPEELLDTSIYEIMKYIKIKSQEYEKPIF